MKRILLLSLLLCSCMVTAAGQNARKILDATLKAMTESGDLKITFRATQFIGTTPDTGTEGVLLISGEKYYMETEELYVWYDGATQWSMFKSGDEVNVSIPTPEEQAAMNPATILQIYKKGYRLSAKKSTLRGHNTYEVHLRPSASTSPSFEEIYVDVDQTTKHPLCIRAKKDGNWMRFAIQTLATHQKTTASQFTFPQNEYPNTEVIDLR